MPSHPSESVLGLQVVYAGFDVTGRKAGLPFILRWPRPLDKSTAPQRNDTEALSRSIMTCSVREFVRWRKNDPATTHLSCAGMSRNCGSASNASTARPVKMSSTGWLAGSVSGVRACGVRVIASGAGVRRLKTLVAS